MPIQRGNQDQNRAKLLAAMADKRPGVALVAGPHFADIQRGMPDPKMNAPQIDPPAFEEIVDDSLWVMGNRRRQNRFQQKATTAPKRVNIDAVPGAGPALGVAIRAPPAFDELCQAPPMNDPSPVNDNALSWHAEIDASVERLLRLDENIWVDVPTKPAVGAIFSSPAVLDDTVASWVDNSMIATMSTSIETTSSTFVPREKLTDVGFLYLPSMASLNVTPRVSASGITFNK